MHLSQQILSGIVQYSKSISFSSYTRVNIYTFELIPLFRIRLRQKPKYYGQKTFTKPTNSVALFLEDGHGPVSTAIQKSQCHNPSLWLRLLCINFTLDYRKCRVYVVRTTISTYVHVSLKEIVTNCTKSVERGCIIFNITIWLRVHLAENVRVSVYAEFVPSPASSASHCGWV